MREVIPNAPAAGNKARARPKQRGERPVFRSAAAHRRRGSGPVRGDAGSDFGRRGAARFPRGNLGQRRRQSRLGDAAAAPAQGGAAPAAAPEGVHQILKWLLDPFTGQKVAIDWASRKPGAVATVDAALAAAGLTMDAVMAQTLALKIDEVDRIDRMIAGAEARRNIALREIDRHRATLGAALRQAADEVLDAEFKEIPPSLTEGEAA